MTGQSADRRHFEKGGADYARHRPTYPARLAQLLADECAGHGNALDVGCGSGQLAVLLATHFRQVTAIDPSKDQLANATQCENVRYIAAPAEDTGLAAGMFDLVTAAQAAHWFDLPRFYAEAQRVARPGATLALLSYGVPELAGSPAGTFRDFYWNAIHAYWPERRRHVEEGYASLDFPFTRRAFPDIAIERSWSFDDLAGYVRTWSAAKRAVAAGEVAIVEDGLQRIADSWQDPRIERTISWPISVLMTRLD